MRPEEVKTVAIVGAGQMGAGIAQVFAQTGRNVILNDIAQKFLDNGLKNISGNFDRKLKKAANDTEKAEIEKARGAVLGRIKATTELSDLAGVDLVIEAAVEDLTLKKELFRKLDATIKPEGVLATNTSSISITELAAITKRAERFVGMHFFNPVPVMKLVEVVRGIATSDETYKLIEELAKQVGKTPVEVKDSPGFVANRLLLPMINEAIFTLYEGVASRDHIDTVMKLGANHPMGPLELADFIGLDTCLSILNVLYDGFKDPKYRPCPLLKKMVAAGWLGKKTGKGFYEYKK
jgi:3-hydroxybutyryl-CoA dehydrogenase